jgi:hypothetical protein
MLGGSGHRADFKLPFEITIPGGTGERNGVSGCDGHASPCEKSSTTAAKRPTGCHRVDTNGRLNIVQSFEIERARREVPMPQALSRFVLEILPWTLAGLIGLFLLAGHSPDLTGKAAAGGHGAFIRVADDPRSLD